VAIILSADRQIAIHEIPQASGSSNHQLRTGSQTLDLRLFRYASDDERSLRHSLRAQLLVLIVNRVCFMWNCCAPDPPIRV